MKKKLDLLLLTAFVVTITAPLTGIHIHKLASLLFFIFCLLHAGARWRKMNIRRVLAVVLVFTAFLTGLLGMIFEEYPILLALHKTSAMAIVFFLAIHIFAYSSKLCPRKAAVRR